MKTVIKLILIYFAMQILGALVVSPFAMLYSLLKYDYIDKASEFTLAPALLAGFILMLIYLWKKGYLTGDRRLYSFVSVSYLSWSIVMGISVIFMVDFLMSHLTFLPDLLKDSFQVLQAGWLGIVCVAIIGPIVEEALFRGAITKVLLKQYSPAVAIVISGLVFGVFHINPAQVVGAIIIGFVIAWIYYRTQSLIPCILIHIMNNSLSVYLNLKYPDVTYTSDLLGGHAYYTCLVLAVLLFALSWRMMNNYKLSNAPVEE